MFLLQNNGAMASFPADAEWDTLYWLSSGSYGAQIHHRPYV